MDINEIETGVLNIICAPTGCGKSHFALNGLNELASKNSKYLYVIDTINGREQKLKETNTAPCNDEWINYIKTASQDVVLGIWDTFDESKIVVITYAKFGVLVKKIPDFGSQFDVIVCDELHSGIKMTAYGKKESNDENHTLRAVNRIKELVALSKVKVIALTATPAIAERHFKGMTRYIQIDENIRRYNTFETIPYTNLEQVIKSLNQGQRGLVYVKSITGMKGALDMAIKAGIKATAIWSISNKDHPMTADQLQVRDYLIQYEGIPPEYDMLIINASCETGINIKPEQSKLDYVVVHNRDEDTQIQVRGRYRDDLQTQYLYSKNAPLCVPDDYISKPLFKKEKDELCDIFMLRNDSNNLVKFRTIKRQLRELGYIILEGDKYRKGNRRYCMIIAP